MNLISCRVGFVLSCFHNSKSSSVPWREQLAFLSSWALTLYLYPRRGSKILDLKTCHIYHLNPTSWRFELKLQNFALTFLLFRRIKKIILTLKLQLQSLYWSFESIGISAFPPSPRWFRNILTKKFCFGSKRVLESSAPPFNNFYSFSKRKYGLFGSQPQKMSPTFEKLNKIWMRLTTSEKSANSLFK